MPCRERPGLTLSLWASVSSFAREGGTTLWLPPQPASLMLHSSNPQTGNGVGWSQKEVNVPGVWPGTGHAGDTCALLATQTGTVTLVTGKQTPAVPEGKPSQALCTGPSLMSPVNWGSPPRAVTRAHRVRLRRTLKWCLSPRCEGNDLVPCQDRHTYREAEKAMAQWFRPAAGKPWPSQPVLIKKVLLSLAAPVLWWLSGHDGSVE